MQRSFESCIKFTKLHQAIKFNEKIAKPYVNLNEDSNTKAHSKFENKLCKLMNDFFLKKAMENIRKHHDIKLETNNKRRNQLVSAPNCEATTCFSEKLPVI